MVNIGKDNQDYIPQYVKIQNYILSRINSGELRVGDKVPSENEISRMFSVSRITANTAIKELVTMGVIYRIKGKGSFVSSTGHTPTATNVFSNNVKLNTEDTVTKKHSVASIRLFKAPKLITERFGIKESDPVFEVIRVVSHSGAPKFVDYTYIPAKYLKDGVLLTDKLSETYIHDYMKKYSLVKPSKVQIFLNTPRSEYLDLSYLDTDKLDSLYIWDTDIYDKAGNLLAFTSTATPKLPSDPFISFLLN